MEFFKFLLFLSNGLLYASNFINGQSNVTSIESDADFSSCSILISKYEILKIRLEITEKFGQYIPEIDEKLKALEFKFEKLYQTLKYQQSSYELEGEIKISTKETELLPSPAVIAGTIDDSTEKALSANEISQSENFYVTDFMKSDPQVCKSTPNSNPVCLNLKLPNSCGHPDGITCFNNKCRIQIKDKPSIVVACDNDWIVIQRRLNGSVDFNRNWSDYKNGFGDLDGEFWLGLEHIHTITASNTYELMIRMEDFDGNIRYANYSEFAIGSEDKKYSIDDLGTYTGNAGNSLNMHANEKFSTYDADNDKNADVNCAQFRSGGWWFFACNSNHDNSNLNGQYYDAESARNVHKQNGIFWTTYLGNSYSLKSVEMAIKEVV